MKVSTFPKELSRRYLRLAAVYRRFAGRSPHYDWSVDSIVECFRHESLGEPASKKNGYVFGKWAKDISVTTWIEDIRKGDACKAEFIFGIDSWWAKPALENVIVPTWFPHQETLNKRVTEITFVDPDSIALTTNDGTIYMCTVDENDNLCRHQLPVRVE